MYVCVFAEHKAGRGMRWGPARLETLFCLLDRNKVWSFLHGYFLKNCLKERGCPIKNQYESLRTTFMSLVGSDICP